MGCLGGSKGTHSEPDEAIYSLPTLTHTDKHVQKNVE